MTDDLDPKTLQHTETSEDEAKEKAKEEALLATKKLIESLEEERRVELEALLAKQKLTQITNENHKAALEEAIKELSKHNLKSPEQKMSLVEWFCRKSPQFNDTVNLLEKTADSLQLPELVESFVKKLDKHFSSPEKNPYNPIRVHGSNPNEIILNEKENLIDQLNEKGVDLDLFDENISKLARPLNRNVPHYVQITLPDNRFLTLDIFQYERDKAQSYGPPSGPKETPQKPVAEGPKNTKGINKKITFAAEVKQEDGTIGTNGYWVSATKKHPKNFSR